MVPAMTLFTETFGDPLEAVAALPAFVPGAGRHDVSAIPHLVCNRAMVARRLGLADLAAYDLLELFAFVRPATFVLPTLDGVAGHLGIMQGEPADRLRLAAAKLISELQETDPQSLTGAREEASFMAQGRWLWAPMVLAALGPRDPKLPRSRPAWSALAEWEEGPQRNPFDDVSVDADEIKSRLSLLLGSGAERREGQVAYAVSAGHSFTLREQAEAPNVTLAEAGTGIGKTLGYVSPASVWAEKARTPVWLSTYTKNLQRQVDQELDRLYPDPQKKRRHVAIRKGRENYLCLLNLEESYHALIGMTGRDQDRILIGLMSRWVRHTRDGDLMGGDFPSWLAPFFGANRIASLTDRRGECLYSGCAHYRKCFIEKAIRKARKADIVIANHALVMAQAVHGKERENAPARYVFDEGHHLFDAADSAFSLHLTGREGAELRRWILGREAAKRGRARGLAYRIGGPAERDDRLAAALQEGMAAASCLSRAGWLSRIGINNPQGVMEDYLSLVRAHVFARSQAPMSGHGIETNLAEPIAGLIEAATTLSRAFDRLLLALGDLGHQLHRLLAENSDAVEEQDRGRYEAIARSILLRAESVTAWRSMLAAIGGQTPEGFVDWFAIDRIDGREIDSGMHRHWIDPTRPFAETLMENTDGVLITSATLRDRSAAAQDKNDWQAADVRTGAHHLVLPPKRISIESPFDYADQTRIFIVTDIAKNNADQIAAAYRELFLASSGGALGIFTAIARLRAVYARLQKPMAAADIPLYAQHVDPMDVGTLIDMARAEKKACLLGTDAVRDGVDIPGDSLRLIVFDRVPWPRPNILHKARRGAFGGQAYDDLLTRLRLKQAYGRLIRRADDKGVFVLLDRACPSRLLTAFPEGVAVERTTLAGVITGTAEFLRKKQSDPGS